jgi:hypothetical protein
MASALQTRPCSVEPASFCTTAPTTSFSVDYSLFERLFRTAVFRLGVYEAGCLEKSLIYLYRCIIKHTFFPSLFDTERAERSLKIFKSLGAQEHFVSPRDGHAKIHMVTLKAKDFEFILLRHGALWKKIEIVDPETQEKKTVFAIIPPKEKGPESIGRSWDEFETSTLSKMGWHKQIVTYEDGSQEEVIITCHNADLIPDEPEQNRRCFLYTHSTSASFIRDRNRAGLYLGMKQDLCFYDNRGIWKSTGIPSEGGYYLDLEAVYEQLQKVSSYDPRKIWAVGYCGGGPVAAHLKAKFHDQGMNFMEEQSFSHFKRDFIDHLFLPVRSLAAKLIPSLFARDMDSLPNKPIECGLNVEELWRHLKPYKGPGGKVILMHANNDERLSPEVSLHYEALAQKTSQAVFRIYFTSPPHKDAHSDDFFYYPSATRQFVRAVFS